MRLIDADAFIEYLGLDAENTREDNVGEIVTLEDFDRQPTVFDKEKVIEQLKEEGCIIDDELGNRAVEIIEKGGIE